MPTAQPEVVTPGTDPRLRHEVEEFYARHFQAGDGGDPVAWAAGFAREGTFSSNARPEPVTGRQVIEAAVTRMFADRAARGDVHRHMLTQLTVEQRPDGLLLARAYVLVVSTRRGADDGGPTLLASTVCEDVLTREDGRLRILSRHVDRDDLPPAAR
ncbi:nuclear transport factor 2 family protein [Streptomyces sp. NPDC093065]|uniref:nuclear transport factor 2 family protein n=1 Tax=Streptomyces sp. NPDC093065 TaxID=3366021 RepID=UPI00380E2345